MRKPPSCLSSRASSVTEPERTLRGVGCASRLVRSIIPDPPEGALCTSRGLVLRGSGGVLARQRTRRAWSRLEDPVPNPDLAHLVVVAARLDRGEQLAKPASGDLCRIERLDEGPGADLAGAHRVAHPGEAH